MSGFSLPLTTFEKFLLWEDRPAYPWSCFLRLRCTGRVDRQALMSAVRAVMPRHPLLTSIIEARGLGGSWVVQPGALPKIEWLAGASGGPFPSAGHQDLRTEIGLRLFVVEGNGTCDMIFQWHHSCSDAIGMQVFVNDLLIAYATTSGADSPPVQLPELDGARLESRGACGLTFRSWMKISPGQRAGLPGVLQFLSRSPSPLIPRPASPDDDPPPLGYPASRTCLFTDRETDALRSVARRLKVTVNDLLARDVYLALGEWAALPGEAWYRMMVPMNLRSEAELRMPAANCVSAVFLDRRNRDFADRRALLSGISSEMRRIKDRRLGYMFAYSLWLVGLIPGVLKYKVRQDKCFVTCIFTNMGKILVDSPLPGSDGKCVSGGLVLEQVELMAPLRPYNCATFAATEYAGRLCMNIHYDPRLVTPARADELKEAFARSVETTISGAT